MVPIRQLMIPASRYGLKSPYAMTPKGIVFHNTAGRASAMQEASAKNGNNQESSIHIFVDENEAVQCLPFNRNSWHAHDGGQGYANRNLISLEVCRSMSDLATFKKAEENAFQVCAQILNQLGLPANRETVRWHREFVSTACPHRTAELGDRDRVIREIQKYMNQGGSVAPPANKGEDDMKYRVYDIIERIESEEQAKKRFAELSQGAVKEFILIAPQPAIGGDAFWRIGKVKMAVESLQVALENMGPDRYLA